MTFRKFLPVILFLLLGGAAGTGLWLTRDPGTAPQPKPKAGRSEAPLVDLQPMATARRLAALATSSDGKRFAHDAERLADHEVDLAFADALRSATNAPPPADPAVRELLAQRARQAEAVQAGEQNLAKLTKSLAAAREQDKDALEDQTDVASAQLELEKDELDATGEALAKLGADPTARLRRLKAAYTDMQKVPPVEDAGPALTFQPGSLLHALKLWTRLHHKQGQLALAQAEAAAKVEELGRRHQDLAKQVAAEKADRDAAHQKAHSFAHGLVAGSRQDAKDTLQGLRHFTEDQRTLAELGKRYQDERDLAEVYQNWRASAQLEARAALHTVLGKAAWILVVLVLVYFAERIFEAIFERIMAGRQRVGRNLKVVKFAAQAMGFVAILVILLGTPSQLTTLFGLAGAGLTVALKDFIMAFFGWFILVGPKGIHVGDWVEIAGVSGEVVEVGVMRTLLLETGNWNDAGHPTGRIVSFVNSFALEGHFFNFSSAGQWLWDELTVTSPAGQDPYPFIDGIKALVTTRTAGNAEKAFQEWEQAQPGNRPSSLKAEPGISVVPTTGGVEVRVRYITCAHERNALREELNHAVVAMLHGKTD